MALPDSTTCGWCADLDEDRIREEFGPRYSEVYTLEGCGHSYHALCLMKTCEAGRCVACGDRISKENARDITRFLEPNPVTCRLCEGRDEESIREEFGEWRLRLYRLPCQHSYHLLCMVKTCRMGRCLVCGDDISNEVSFKVCIAANLRFDLRPVFPN